MQKPKRRLKDFITGYLEYTKDSQSPLQFHFWTAVSTIAGALRRHVYFDQVLFRWHPNFYIVFVAKPGVANKSTTMDIGMRLLSKIEGVFFGPESTTWQALIQQMAQARTMVDYGDGVPIPMCAVTVPIGEFGTFFSSKDNMMTDHLVSLWDGKKGRFEKKTKTSGSDQIDNPFINLITGTTPSWIKENFPDYMIGGGFMSRCIFVYGTEPAKFVPYLKARDEEDRKTQEKAQEELEDALTQDLYAISEMRGEYKLSREAYDFGVAWYLDLMQKTPPHLKDDSMSGYLQRKQSHVHKIAMVLAASESNELVLQVGHLQKAVALTDALEKDLPKIFANIGGSADALVTEVLYNYIKNHGPVNKADLYSKFMHKYQGRILEQAILALQTADLVTSKMGGNNRMVFTAKERTEK